MTKQRINFCKLLCRLVCFVMKGSVRKLGDRLHVGESLVFRSTKDFRPFKYIRDVVEDKRFQQSTPWELLLDVELYVGMNISRMKRQTISLNGSLSLVYETGTYSRSPIPIDDRLSLVCDNGSVESERHFLMECSLYSDLCHD